MAHQESTKEKIFHDIGKRVAYDPKSVARYNEEADFESLHKAFQSSIATTLEKDVNTGIYSPADLSPPRQQFLNLVIERETRKKIWEEITICDRIAIHLCVLGKSKKGADLPTVKDMLAAESKRLGEYFDSPESKRHIQSFIKYYNVELDGLAQPDISKFPNFNSFFYRELKKGARKIAEPDNDNVIVSAADSRLSVFQTIDLAQKYWIKGKEFSLEQLFNNKELAKEFNGGSIAIFRLAQGDYHRFHSPISAEVGSITPISGTYYSVDPFMMNGDYNVLTENARSVLILKSPKTKVVYIAVGALLVGSVKYTVSEGDSVKKGDELGHFAYGGSTVAVVFKKGDVLFDQDLIEHSKSQIEMLVKVGMRIGVRP